MVYLIYIPSTDGCRIIHRKWLNEVFSYFFALKLHGFFFFGLYLDFVFETARSDYFSHLSGHDIFLCQIWQQNFFLKKKNTWKLSGKLSFMCRGYEVIHTRGTHLRPVLKGDLHIVFSILHTLTDRCPFSSYMIVYCVFLCVEVVFQESHITIFQCK